MRHPFKNSRDILLARICLGSSGFTVIELLVLMTILAILAALLLPPLRDTLANRQARAQARAEMALISEALERYRAYYGDYPLIDDDPEAFFSALHGRRGPKSTIDAGSARRFINAASFTLRHPFRNDSADANALIDPWGEPYFYTYKNSERTVQNGCLTVSFLSQQAQMVAVVFCRMMVRLMRTISRCRLAGMILYMVVGMPISWAVVHVRKPIFLGNGYKSSWSSLGIVESLHWAFAGRMLRSDEYY